MLLSELESKRGLKIRFRQDRQDLPLRKGQCLSAKKYSLERSRASLKQRLTYLMHLLSIQTHDLQLEFKLITADFDSSDGFAARCSEPCTFAA